MRLPFTLRALAQRRKRGIPPEVVDAALRVCHLAQQKQQAVSDRLTDRIQQAAATVQKVESQPETRFLRGFFELLRAKAVNGNAADRRRFDKFGARSFAETFASVPHIIAKAAPIPGRPGDDGFAAGDDAVIQSMFADVASGKYASPNAALIAYSENRRFRALGTPESVRRRIKAHSTYRRLMKSRQPPLG